MTRSSSVVKIHLLGRFSVEFSSKPVSLPTKPTSLLLAYLALHRDESIPREKLAGLFWGKGEFDWDQHEKGRDSDSAGSTDKRARGSLRTALSHIRRSLGADFFQEDNETVQLNPARQVWIDAVEFQSQVEEFLATSPTDPSLVKLELYQGDLLLGFDDDPDEPWIVPRREALRDLYRDALLRLAEHLRASGEYEQAAARAQKVLELEPYNEQAHQHLMLCHFMQGNKSQALAQYWKLEQALRGEFGKTPFAEPSADSKGLYNRIKKAQVQTIVSPALLTNLPNPLTRFIGREQDLTELERLFAGMGTETAPVRLVALTGPGGCGKTRLAIQLARQLLDRYRDGGWWIELEALEQNQELVTRATAKALGVREQADRELVDTLIDCLRTKQLLLVMDNCEHLLLACVQLCEKLLQACPGLQVLATSREAFRMPGGIDYPVPPFAFPDEQDLPSPQALGRYEAISFFLDRARVQRQEFALTEQSAPCVAQICRRLDGIPLAIELAAARMRTLSPEYIASHLDDRFKLLSKGPRTPARHQTLSAVIDWSYDLLEAHERQLLNELGVFAGRFTFEAAEAVCAIQGSNIHIRELLESLCDKSLVVLEVQSSGEARYRLLDTVRQYARDKLQASQEEADAAFARMARYYLGFARQHEKDYVALEQEWENLGAGLRSAHRQKKWEQVIEYGYALTPACFARGFYTEARRIYPWVCEAAEALEEQEAYIASMLKWGQAFIEQGFYLEAQEILERLLRICREAYDQGGIASAQFLLARIDLEKSRYQEARERLAESQRLREQLGDRAGVAETFYLLANIRFRLYDDEGTMQLGQQALEIQESLPLSSALIVTLRLLSLSASYQNQHELAEQYGQRALTLCEELQDQTEYAVALYSLSLISRQRGDLARARENGEKSLTLLKRLGDRKSEAHVLTQLGRIALDLQEYETAQAHAAESLALLRELQDAQHMASVLLLLGDIAKQKDQPELAKQRWAEALPIAESIKHPMAELIRQRLDQV